MLGRNYYYLVAGLPDIVLEQGKLSVSLADFRNELRAHLHPDDYRLLQLLFLPADNRNVLTLLQKKNSAFDPAGNYTADELEEEIREPQQLPAYLRTFIGHFKSNVAINPGMSWEDQLAGLFYDELLDSENEFLRAWFGFDRNLRNILTGFNARRFKLQAGNLLVGNDSVTLAIQKSNARDFGLSTEFPYVDKLIQISENPNPLEREKAIDHLKWNYIDELNTFNYFSIEVILGFVIRLAMVERWLSLDRKTGADLFRRLLKDLENSYEFPKAFNI